MTDTAAGRVPFGWFNGYRCGCTSLQRTHGEVTARCPHHDTEALGHTDAVFGAALVLAYSVCPPLPSWWPIPAPTDTR